MPPTNTGSDRGLNAVVRLRLGLGLGASLSLSPVLVLVPVPPRDGKAGGGEACRATPRWALGGGETWVKVSKAAASLLLAVAVVDVVVGAGAGAGTWDEAEVRDVGGLAGVGLALGSIGTGLRGMVGVWWEG